MKATEAKLLEFLKKSPQFVIPIYQRTYSWTKDECDQLWDDILRAGRNDSVAAHFMGSVVYIEQGVYHVSHFSPLLVIDGQQRLTSVSLLLEALARHITGPEPIDGFSAKKLRNYYLLNPEEEGERGFKLLLTQTDKQTLLSILEQKDWPKEYSIRVRENFEFFMQQVGALKDDLAALCKGLSKLMIVDIALTRDQDNPQLIFESMNSTGRELSQADLIRNFVLMGLQPDHQTQLYEDHWRPMEIEFGQEAYGEHFDSFMRHYLTFRTGSIPNVDEVYRAFKNYARSGAGTVDELVAEIHALASYYCAMALGKEPDKGLAEAFQDLRELQVNTAYPFLLELYHDYKTGVLTRDELLKAVRLIEAYVFRRAVCAIPTNSLNKTFATFGRALKKDRYLESIQAHLLLLPSYRRFPSDEEFKREMMGRDLYIIRKANFCLRRLENQNRKERISLDEYTIEHITPQNPNLSAAWREALGADWKQVQEKWLHTLGNLTLTRYNSEYSDRPFIEKREMEGGFGHSPLYLNDGLGQVDTWNEGAIKARAERLTSLAVKVWSAPQLDAAIVEAYKPSATQSGTYSLNDHPYLLSGKTQELFEAFRKEVCALDPNVVTEEFFKLYVAYKAETNFVDVVPQAKRLRLSLNMKFHEINDPKGICKDVTHLGRWGNGDVEVGLESLEELPYVMSLVRQSFDRQAGHGA